GADPAMVVTTPRGVALDCFSPAWVTPDRIEALRQAWGTPEEPRITRFLLAGRLTRIKGHLTIIAAAARLKAQGRADFQVLFAGDDQGRVDYRQELILEIERAGLSDVVRIVGHCDDMPAAYLLCDVAIL